MDREELFEKVIDQRNASLIKEAESQARIDEAERRKQEFKAELLAPFTALRDRNFAALDTLGDLIRGGNQWGVVNRRKEVVNHGQGKVVVLGDAKVTPATPDHVGVCLASIVKPKYATEDQEYSSEVSWKNQAFAQFKFAIIPREFLPAVLGPEGYTLSDAPKDQSIITVEAFKSSGDILSEGTRVAYENHLSRKIRKRSSQIHKLSVDELAAHVTQFEQNLDMILEASSDQLLNPHLIQPVQEIGSVAIQASTEL